MRRPCWPQKGLVADMKPDAIIVPLLAAALLVAGCASRPMPMHHPPTAVPAPVTPSSTQPVINTAQSISICKDVRRWLPAAWSQDPPHFSTQLASDQMKAQGTLGTDLSNLQTNLEGLSAATYMGTSTGIRAVQRDCAALGVKFKLPNVPPTGKCWHRFRKWQNGSVRFEINSMANALSSFNRNSNSNIYVAVVFLHIAANAARLAQRWPIPACADPGEYWSTYLTDEQKMGSDVGSPSSATSNGYLPDAAISDQQQAQSAFNSLQSELAQTTGHHPFG